MSMRLKKLKHGDLEEAAIIVRDPGRVSPLAKAFDKRSTIVSNREFLLMNGYYKNQRVSVCSTGMGVDSTEVYVSRLLENGTKQIVRCGDCDAQRDDIEPGDIILNTEMAQTAGLMTTYVPDTYPAVADSLLISRIAKHLSGSERIHIRSGLTAEAYYVGQGGGITIKGKTLPVPSMTGEWSSLGVIGCEMEIAVLYILASLCQIPVVNCLAVHVSRKNERWEYEGDYRKLHYEMAQFILNATLEPSTQCKKEA